MSGSAAAVDTWLEQLGLAPLTRVQRDGATAWDLLLDGRRRFDLRLTIIWQPGVGLVVWLPFAPPVQDGHRRTYQQLLQWNDELPFVKFGLDPELRVVLSAEIAPEAADARALGLAIARALAVCDRLLEASARWLWPGGAPPAPEPGRVSRGRALLDRYVGELAELTGAPATLGRGDRVAERGAPDREKAGGR